MSTVLETLSGKNINFLIGSGASMPLFQTLSLGPNLPSFEEVLSSKMITDNNKILLYCYYYAKWISPMQLRKMENEPDNYSVTQSSYKKFINLLLDILTRESNEKPKRANIFTTNYDLLFESAFDSIICSNPLCFFNDGSRGFINKKLDTDNYYLNVSHSGFNDNYKREVPTINLFKMHGSVSWGKEKDEHISVNYKNNCMEKLDEILENENFELEKIDRIFNLTSILGGDIYIHVNKELTDLNFDQTFLAEFYDVYKTLPIINPDKWKFHETVFEQHYYQMIRSFSYEMEKRDTVLIVFAFSFADEHIKNIFKRSMLNPSLKVIIIAYDEANLALLKIEFSQYNNVEFYPANETKADGSKINGNFDFMNNMLTGCI